MNTTRKRKRKILWGRVILVPITIALIVACCIARPVRMWKRYRTQAALSGLTLPSDSILRHAVSVDSLFCTLRTPTLFTDAQEHMVKHPILSVPSYTGNFPDENDIQLASAIRLGLKSPIQSHEESDVFANKLVYIGASPFFDLRPMTRSMPYLVPRADRLLNVIARNFQDSLICKGLPLHKIEVSSALRTIDDVKRLRRGNVNAKNNSCHLYGTTFDISYNYFTRVGESRQTDSTANPYGVELKQVLAEVLRDLREKGTCYVKYERKQPCFHITCR